MLDRHRSPSYVKGNDRDNGGADNDDGIVLSTFTATSPPPAISLDGAIQKKLASCQRKMDLASNRLKYIIRQGGDTQHAPGTRGSHGRLQQAQRER